MDKGTIRILMFPWLGYGHITPYLELAKKLTTRNFVICLCSTPANLSCIKQKISEKFAQTIQLVSLHLPTLPGLPPHLHTTNGLPLDLMPTLKVAFDMAEPEFANILSSIKPDLLIYDFLQPWAPLAASVQNIPAVEFITSSSTMTSFMFHYFKKPGIEFPFPNIYFREYESKLLNKLLACASDPQEKNRASEGVARSCKIVLIKGARKTEAKYIDYVTELVGKKFVPAGLLVQEPSLDNENSEIIEWLNKKEKKSTVFVSFGSEYFLSKQDTEEIAHGLELSNINFIWVVRFPKGVEHKLEETLPKGFLEIVRGRGLVIEGWAPQLKILGHENIGGFLSHCGWNSVLESMHFGVPIIALPMHLDQPINARFVEDIGVGVEVVRDSKGQLHRERLAEVIKQVVMEKSGESVREKADEIKVKISDKGDQEIDEIAAELVEVCNSGPSS
ncbi:beta-D-glucosyl crocetin beta-1,6-glucosyltransferase-like [Olea europaea subsp. europaea]|uniref:Glycosyltransferase n=1 Tax=Olea europaea subsp. europaea TaxID=158383 RepID=A0A8S0RTS5_OLEEU|nr:beta-D-glucosyl crocetin beta-1,6-glucosyltransferase-like [Olea europaea subsp. europaea]